MVMASIKTKSKSTHTRENGLMISHMGGEQRHLNLGRDTRDSSRMGGRRVMASTFLPLGHSIKDNSVVGHSVVKEHTPGRIGGHTKVPGIPDSCMVMVSLHGLMVIVTRVTTSIARNKAMEHSIGPMAKYFVDNGLEARKMVEVNS